MSDPFGALRDRALKVLGESSGGITAVDAVLHEMQVLHAELEIQQEELRESQRHSAEHAAYYRQLFFDSPLAFVVLTETGEVKETNQRGAWLLGWHQGEASLPFHQFVAAEDLGEWRRLEQRVAERSGSTASELHIRKVGGARRLCRVTISARQGGGRLLGLEDLTALREAESRQRIASERAAQVLRDTSDGVLFVNVAGRLIEEANDATAHLLATTAASLRGRPLVSLFPPALAVRQELLLKKAVLQRPMPLVALTLVAANGTHVETEVALGELIEGPVRLLSLLLRDVSARARLTAEKEELARTMMESQKLEAVGQLAAGVAHDMNNMLTVILSCASEPLPVHEAELREALGEVRSAAMRGRELTGRLSALYRRRPLREARFDLVALVDELAGLLRRTLPQSITIEVNLPDAPWWVMGDEGAWHQALLNLAINARDAMPHGGRLRLACLQTPSGRELLVSDDGVGMSPEIAARAFEPFFTTKPEGQGTGLGLAHVHAVARAHHVDVRCESKLGEGTRFRFLMPPPPEGVLSPVVNEPVGAVPVKLPRLVGRVLLVDDDALGRKATARLLKRSGAEVVEASSGQEALAVLARDAGFVAMLTDLAMPEMDGEALAARVRDAWPQLAVVVFTGEVRDDRLQRLLGLGVKRVVSKPYTVVELVDALLSAAASTSMARAALTQPR